MSQITRLAVYLRSPVPEATEQRQSYVLGRAEWLRQRGLAETVTVTYWHRLSDDRDPREAAEIESLERWASRHGCTLAPTFDRRDRHSAYTGRDTVVTLPVACVATWTGDEVTGVYPHAGPCGHCTVADGLDRIEATGGAERQTGSHR